MNTENKNGRRCWNAIGIWGDSSCEKLASAIHCVNCDVYSDAAKELFSREIPAEYFDEWSGGCNKVSKTAAASGRRFFLFSCGGKLFALPTAAISELSTMRMIHTIPYKRDAAIKGLVNIDGELVLTVDILRLFSLSNDAQKDKCIIVCAGGGDRFAFTAEFAKGSVSPDADSLVDADVNDPWYVGKKFKIDGEDAVLIDYEILIGAITKKHI